jgi:outer membrane protein assembly factor BamA
MTGLRFNNDEDELEERIRAKFQDRGYFTVQVQNLDIKVIDPLASPKAVRLEAEVADGPRCRLSGFNFSGNHNLSSAALRAKFSIKLGDPFRRDRIAGGLEGMRKLYASQGFLDSVFIPDTEVDSSATVKLNIEVHEGPQYRMGEFQVFAPPAIAAKLQTQWKLQPGTVFDRSYVETFLEKNHALLPDDFTLEDGVKMLKDCPDAIVSVHFHVTHDPQHEALDRGEPKDCEPAAGAVPADQ